MKNKNQARQGDVLITKTNAKPIKGKDRKSNILAHGEATGHHHSVEDAAKVYDISPEDMQSAADLIVEVQQASRVIHQEHGPVPVKHGRSVVRRQSEYSPEAIRRVAD